MNPNMSTKSNEHEDSNNEDLVNNVDISDRGVLSCLRHRFMDDKVQSLRF
jgi:hypothetical protein